MKAFFYISLLFLYLITGAVRFSFAQDGAQLDITSETECKTLGGTWNECPPNECQESEGYKKGEVACGAVCGNPRCEGIVPEEEGDLSEIHNPTVYEQAVSSDEKRVAPNDAVTPVSEPSNADTAPVPSALQSIKDFFAGGESVSALLVILGLVIVYAYFLMKHKKRKR